MAFLKKKFAWAVIYTIILVSFTLYVALDTFVIQRVYTTVPSGENSSSLISSKEDATSSLDEQNAGDISETNTEQDNTEQNNTSQSSDPIITDSSYSDQNISVTITEYREYDTTIYVADVRVSSVEYLQTAFAQNQYGRNITENTSAIAEANNAILAVNGDYYGSQTKGYVLKNGVLYRETTSQAQEDLVIWADGSFEIVTESEVTAATLLENGALQVLSFGPALVDNGSVSVSENDEVGKAMASNPRTAIGIVDDLHYIFVVSDGRTTESKGLSLYQLAGFMNSLGADTAYNLDGGGSSTMYFNGEVINKPTSNGKSIRERSVSDIVYIGY